MENKKNLEALEKYCKEFEVTFNKDKENKEAHMKIHWVSSIFFDGAEYSRIAKLYVRGFAVLEAKHYYKVENGKVELTGIFDL